MPNQVDMNAALESFQAAYKTQHIVPMQCQLHADLVALRDDANGDTRWTFARIDAAGTVLAIVSVLPAEPYKGKPCFALAYAVAAPYRNQGVAKDIVTRSIEEVHNGFRRRIPQFYIEVVVDMMNTESNRVASKVINDSPIEITDQFSGDPALQYFRLVG